MPSPNCTTSHEAEQAVERGRTALRQALDNDPVIQAGVALRAAQGRRHGGAILRNAIAQRLGLDPVPVPGPGHVDLPTFVTTYVERRGAQEVADGEDQYWAAREEAVGE